MPKFFLTEEGWFGPTSFVVQNNRWDDILFIDNDGYWNDDFLVRDADRGCRLAEIQDSTALCGPYAYEITHAKSKRICATLTHMNACCSESFELDVYDDDKTRTFYFDETSFFRRDYALTRNGKLVASYYAGWWSPGEIDIYDDYVEDDKDLTAIILFSCVILERIHRRQARQQAQQTAMGVP